MSADTKVKYSVIDLFAGAGGLSYGFLKTGLFEIKAAVEKNSYAQKTYLKNHSGVKMYNDVCIMDYEAIDNMFGNIDIVIGGPPCQGFSNANRQKNYTISMNNMLIKQYVRAILELNPKVFVMENVSMLKSDIHRFFVEKNELDKLTNLGVKIKDEQLELIKSKYIFDNVLNLIKSKELCENYLWPQKMHTCINIIYKSRNHAEKLSKKLKKYKNSLLKIAKILNQQADNSNVTEINKSCGEAILDYFADKISADILTDSLSKPLAVQKLINNVLELSANNIHVYSYETLKDGSVAAQVKSYAVLDYINKVLSNGKGKYQIIYGVLNAADYGVPQKRMRFVLMGRRKDIPGNLVLPAKKYEEKKYATVREAIRDLEQHEPVFNMEKDSGIAVAKNNMPKTTELAQWLQDTDTIYNHITTKTTEIALERFKSLKQGENFHNLKEDLKINTYSDAERTQNTIYLRLEYDEPSGTVVNVRKSMWIHPIFDRAISIREAARLQAFPDSFVFVGSKDSQYQQVGNAVPPLLGKAIAENIIAALDIKVK